jgi:hypothetical protein
MTTDTTTSTTEAAPVDTSTTETTTDTSTETAADETTLLGGAGDGTDEGGDEGQGGEGEPAAEAGAPEAYEITLNDADGNPISLDQEMLTAATEVFKEFGLTNEQANKLVPLGYQMMQKGMEAAEANMVNVLADTRKAWLEEFKADPEIGGGKQDESLHLASKALDALGFAKGTPFRELLDLSGLGNHRDMIFAFRKLGELISEDSQFANPQGVSEDKQVGWADRYKSDD